ncbi:HNH endonuclease [Sorangium sp. So ce269]
MDAAFPDAAAFWKKAKAFEKLAEQGAKRKKGFARYAPEVLPCNKSGTPDFPPAWRTDTRVRKAIAGMSHGFCAYCQSPVSSTHSGTKGKHKPPGQVEHFRPKARFPAQAYDWGNYFLVCMGCNGAKHDKWPSAGYVRPDEGEPGSQFVFAKNGKVRACKGNERAKYTVEDFSLNRYWLSRHRGMAIQLYLNLVNNLMGRSELQLEDLLVEGPSQFSEAINQNVRRAWARARR